MCVMSAVTDHYQQQWPVPNFNRYPWLPASQVLTVPITITPEQWAEYQRLKEAAAEIDRVTGQPDCVKPGVDEWEAGVLKYVGSPVTAAIQHYIDLGIESDTAHRMAIQTKTPDHRYDSAADAVHSFAIWQETSEGFRFWYDISDFYAVARGE